MFETESFRTRLTSVVSTEAADGGLREYETEVVSFLQNLAAYNETALMETELRKTASLRRGIPEALSSARELAKLASSYATADRRSRLTEADIKKAYRAKYCQVWPFCR